MTYAAKERRIPSSFPHHSRGKDVISPGCEREAAAAEAAGGEGAARHGTAKCRRTVGRQGRHDYLRYVPSCRRTLLPSRKESDEGMRNRLSSL